MPAPYTIGAGAILEATLESRLFGQQILLVRHYRIDPDDIGGPWPGPQTAEEFIDEWDRAVTGLTTRIVVYQTSDMNNIRIKAQWIYPTRFAYVEKNPANTNGTQPAPTMPQNTALVGTLQSESAGSAGRGNVFFTGWEATVEDSGLITGVAKGHVQEMLNFLTESITTATDAVTLIPVVYHKAAPALSKFITHGKPQDTLRVMRRRTVGHGT